MEAIRKMEPAWEKVHGSKFRLMRREVAIGNGRITGSILLIIIFLR